MEEMKQCFFHLNYLPNMKIQSEEESKQSKALDHTYQTTTRSMMIQEKEFVFNLWSILNPLNSY